MSTPADPFFGNDPEDIWDEGYAAAQAGRSMDTNPFRTGEAEELHRIGTELGAQSGSTPGSSSTRVTGEQYRDILRREKEAEGEGT